MVNITPSVIESMDNLTYRYNSGNQLKTVTDAGTTDGFKQGSGDYLYDANGNMTVDPNKGLSDIKYNYMNLPHSITKGSKKIGYVYDATGRKLANKLSGKTKYYLGSFVYTDDKLEYMICSEGLLNINGSTTNYEFHLKDHLGNTRVAVNETNDITQTINYYPFGLTFAQSGSSTNKYLYNGKELQEETGFIDYGARMYTPELGRWFNIDPLAEQYLSQSTYHFSGNNPLKYVDNNGKDYAIYFSEKKDDKGNVTYTATIKATYYVKTGDDDAKKSAEAATGFWNDMTGQYTYTVGKGDDAKTYDVEFNLNVVEVDDPIGQGNIDKAPYDREGKLIKEGSSNSYSVVEEDYTSAKGGAGSGVIKVEKPNMLDKTGPHEIGHTLGIDHSDGLMHEGINGSPFWTVYEWDIRDIFINRPAAKAKQYLYGDIPKAKKIGKVRKKK